MGGIESNQSPHTDDGDEDESRVIFLADGNPDISIRKGVKKILRRGVPPLICYACIPVFGTKIYAVEAGCNLFTDGFCKNTFTNAGFWNLYIPILLP